LVLLGQMPQDGLFRVGTVSCRIGVGEAIEGVAAPGLDSLKPHLLDLEAKTSIVEIHQSADASKIEAPRVKSSVGC
jgi:hypothetical protein